MFKLYVKTNFCVNWQLYLATTSDIFEYLNPSFFKGKIYELSIIPVIRSFSFFVDICVYNGQLYKQGQQWYDGCNSVCVCEDAKTGYYRCQPR